MERAFLRIRECLDSPDLAARDLYEGLLTGRLPSAIRAFERGVEVQTGPLDAQHWKQVYFHELSDQVWQIDAEASSTAPQPFEERWKIEEAEHNVDGSNGWQVKYRLKGKEKWRALRWFDAEEEASACIDDIKDVLSEALVIEKTGRDWHDEWSDEFRKNQELVKRLDLITNALRAKEKQADRAWPATMTAKQTKKRDQTLEQIQYWQRALEALYGEVTGKRSWRVEITTKDGARHQNGCRFSTKDQAEFYQQNFGPRDFGDDYAKGEIIACEDDPSNVAVHGDHIGFDHGGCVLFNWSPVESADTDDPAASAETEYAAADTGAS